MSIEKGNCDICGTEIDVEMCCSGSIQSGCGCMGMPIDPPICSEDCYGKWLDKRSTISNSNPKRERKQ